MSLETMFGKKSNVLKLVSSGSKHKTLEGKVLLFCFLGVSG